MYQSITPKERIESQTVSTHKEEKHGLIPQRNRIDIDQLMELPRSERRRIGKILHTKIKGIDRVDRSKFGKKGNI